MFEKAFREPFKALKQNKVSSYDGLHVNFIKFVKPFCTIKHVSNFKHKTTALNLIIFYSNKTNS